MQVLVRDNNVDQALKALKKKMQREGIFREMKLRGHYEKPSEKRAREKAEAVRRARKLARKKMQREGLLPMKPKIVPGRASDPPFPAAANPHPTGLARASEPAQFVVGTGCCLVPPAERSRKRKPRAEPGAFNYIRNGASGLEVPVQASAHDVVVQGNALIGGQRRIKTIVLRSEVDVEIFDLHRPPIAGYW